MKKYTVVYGSWFQIGSHRNSTTHYKHLEGKSAQEAVDNAGIEWSDIWFVFDGHCLESAMDKTSKYITETTD